MSSSLYTELKLSKTTSPNKLLHNDCVTLYVIVGFPWSMIAIDFWLTLWPYRSLSFNPDHIHIYSSSWGPNDDGRLVVGISLWRVRSFVIGWWRVGGYYLLIHELYHMFWHSFIRWGNHVFIQWFINVFIHLFIHLFIHSFVHSSIYSFYHLFIDWCFILRN